MSKEKDIKPEGELMDEKALKIARETLTGDIRDIILNDMKDRKSSLPWSMRKEAEQEEVISQITRLSESVVARAVKIVAAGGRRTILAHLNKVTIKDEIKAEIELSKADQQRHELMDAVGCAVMIVIADAEIYHGEREPVFPAKDEPEMFDPETGEIKSPPKSNGKEPPHASV